MGTDKKIFEQLKSILNNGSKKIALSEINLQYLWNENNNDFSPIFQNIYIYIYFYLKQKHKKKNYIK